MGEWISKLGFSDNLDENLKRELERLQPVSVAARTVLFRPGDEARGFILLVKGRVNVYLTGRNGRELLLYSVEPGETCLQTTLGLLGDAPYGGEGVAETDATGYVIPPPLFLRLMAGSEGFRRFVFRAFANRLSDSMFVLEQVAFVKVEARLARELLSRAGSDGQLEATHQQIAVAIGTVREVVSRRLEALASDGLILVDRGHIRILDRRALESLAGE
jgi:CRP/FNR family transcriptional regulator, anaerobic regulatory protein